MDHSQYNKYHWQAQCPSDLIMDHAQLKEYNLQSQFISDLL